MPKREAAWRGAILAGGRAEGQADHSGNERPEWAAGTLQDPGEAAVGCALN